MPRNELQQFATISPGTLPRSITPAQGLALAELLAGKTMTTAAQAAGVNRTTVWRWLNEDAHFAAFYNSARAEMAASAEQSLRLLSARAVVTLRRLMTRRSVPDSVKLGAAMAVLKHASVPIEGPTNPQDAQNAMLTAAKDSERAGMLAQCGLGRSELMNRLKQSFSERQLDEDPGDEEEDVD